MESKTSAALLFAPSRSCWPCEAASGRPLGLRWSDTAAEEPLQRAAAVCRSRSEAVSSPVAPPTDLPLRPVVPDSLRDQLQTSLGAGYTLLRELGGGGMSRVYVAREEALGRDVVVKVLAPELAEGLSAERFAREVRLVAALQEPHIVPVLTAGVTADGMPYFTMPLVAGESLRARLQRRGDADEGPVPMEEAVRILRDVAEALEYAHERGIVHRDIKPENVLLSGRNALVVDFGIAKALQVSRTTPAAGRAGATLTQLGTSLGTPAYMAPEQAAGDPATDHRTDLYAWGVVAYELLAGRHPFAGKTSAQQLMAAHFAEVPADLSRTFTGPGRAPVPRPLAALVARCLAKEPGARPQSAAEIIAALHEADGEVWDAPRRGRRHRVAAGVLATLLVLLVGGWYAVPASLRASLRVVTTRHAPVLVVNRVVVAQFKDDSGDPKLASLGGVIADYVTEGLSRLGSLQVVDSRTAVIGSTLVSGIPRLLRSSNDKALGEETGARVVVAGSYYVEGDSVLLRARILDAETGAVREALPVVSAPVKAPGSGVTALAGRIVAALRAASDTLAVDFRTGDSPPPSLEAFEALRQGVAAYMSSARDTAVMIPLRRAVALDTTWATALQALSWIASEYGYDADADSALARAARLRVRPMPTEQAYLDVTEARARGDVAGMLAAARRTTTNDMLVAYCAILARRPGFALQVLESGDPDRGINLAMGRLYWKRLYSSHLQRGEYDEAISAARETEKRYPGSDAEAEAAITVRAARGDVEAVRASLEEMAAREVPGPVLARNVVTRTMMLRARGNRDAEGQRIARRWAERMAASAQSFAPDLRGALVYSDLFIAAERWPAALRSAEADQARLDVTVGRGLASPLFLRVMRAEIASRRAIALVHLGRRAEALAIDTVLSLTVGKRWDFGRSALARGRIAAHLGDRDRAVRLLAEAVSGGAVNLLERYVAPSADMDPLLLPLRTNPGFIVLARSDPADVK
jgi:tRNA A-37 threonylcarbamoyl transferase component Bud32/TolB-like protein